jgi:hypothetical protein
MTPIAAESPLSVAATLPRSDGPDGKSADWHKELLRAQARAWFHGPLPAFDATHVPHAVGCAATAAGAAAADPSLGAAGAEARSSVPGALGRAGAARPVEIATRHGHARQPSDGRGTGLDVSSYVAPGRAAPSEGRSFAGLPMPPASARFRPGAPQAALTAQPQRQRAPTAAVASSVSVHLEQTDEGARAWLGVSGDAATVAARAQVLSSELRRALQSAHQRLAVVVCNGHTMYSNAPLGGHKELP